MFIGHYGAAFAARAAKPAIPLWQLFVAVQLVDFAWAGLVLVGIEKFDVTPGFMEASILDLHHMPYTHSLVAALIWAIAAGGLYAALRRGGNAFTAGLIIAAAIIPRSSLSSREAFLESFSLPSSLTPRTLTSSTCPGLMNPTMFRIRSVCSSDM